MKKRLISFLLSTILFYSCTSYAVADLKLTKQSIENTSTKYNISAVVEYQTDTGSKVKTKVFYNMEPGEIRIVDSSLLYHAEYTKIRSAHFEKFSFTDLVADFLKFLALFLGAAVTVAGSIAIYRYQRSLGRKHEINILISEMEDVKRHLKANLGLVKKIKIDDNHTPLDFYIRRLHTWDDLIMNSQETYKNINHKKTRYLAHARLLVRNIDIECKSLLRYIKKGKVSQETLNNHLKFIRHKHQYLIAWIRIAVRYLKQSSPNSKNFEKEIKDIRVFKDELFYEQHKSENNAMENKLDIRTRDSADLKLENYIIMPPSSKVSELGVNILHINTNAKPYTDNASAATFIAKIRQANSSIKQFNNDSSTLEFAVKFAMGNNEEGVFIEFGFCTGTSLNFIAALAYNRKVYAFDSIKGLKTTWRTGFDANVFAYKDEHRFPFTPLANTSLVIGWIEDSLPLFTHELLQHETVAFINIDTDSFQSAKFILDTLKDKITPQKTIIALDEGYNFSDPKGAGDEEWKKHEYLAVNQFAEENNYSIQYLAYNKNHQQLVLTFVRK